MALATAALILPAVGAWAEAYQRPGTTVLVSSASDGASGNNHAASSSGISADGRYIALTSFASNLVPGDTNSTRDVFVHDRQTSTIERVSVASDGTQANAISISPPAISGDGRYVAFPSYASNLVPGDTNGKADVFVHDRLTGMTALVSVASDGTRGDGDSVVPAISGDGRYVAFTSHATNLVPGDTNAMRDAFVHDLSTGTTERVSVSSSGAQAHGESIVPALNADGRFVAFDSTAPDLVASDLNAMRDIFVHDRATGATERVSVASGGGEGNRDAGWGASLSADARYVAFYSDAFNLVPGDTNNNCGVFTIEDEGSPKGFENCADVFVRDRLAGTTERVSVSSDGVEGDRASHAPSISGDGRLVAFQSDSSTLVPGDTNNSCGFSGTWNCRDVFVHDRIAATTERVSVASDGREGNGDSGAPAITPDGGWVVFDSSATNLVPGDENLRRDMFVRWRGPLVGIGGLDAAVESGSIHYSGWATFSGAVVSTASDSQGDGVGSIGAEIVDASVTYRPELGDLLLRLRLASLPQPVVGGAPGLVYRWSFVVGATTYEVRAARVGASVSAEPSISLYACTPSCQEVGSLRGGIGTAGAEIRASVPLTTVGVEAGVTLKSVAAAVLGGASSAPAQPLDSVSLGDTLVPAPYLDLGIAPSSSSMEDVSFTYEAVVVHGRFSGTIDVFSKSPGAYRVWAKGCIASACGASSVVVTI